MFTSFLKFSYIPPGWKISKILPLYKGKGPIDSVNSFRPISITCVISKIFERIIYDLLMVSVKNRLSNKQHGFKSNRSTITNLLIAYDYITRALDNYDNVDMILLDLSKAFDRVPHGRLCDKLISIGVSRTLSNIVYCFLSNRYQFVNISDESSTILPVTSGVPQGTILGPLLFSIYINDLLTASFNSVLLAFADDLKIIGKSGASIQCDLDYVSNWCIDNNMILNIEKCKILHFNKILPMTNYFIGRCVLQASECEKDLGIVVDDELSFDSHINSVVKKCFFVINQLFRSISSRDRSLFLRLYKCYVIPMILYGSCVYHPVRRYHFDKLESIQHYFTRKLIGCQYSYDQRLSILDLPSIESRFIFADIVYFYKLVVNPVESNPISDLSSLSYVTLEHSDSKRYNVERCNNSSRLSFYTIRVVKSWNSLPIGVRRSTNLVAFKKSLYLALNHCS